MVFPECPRWLDEAVVDWRDEEDAVTAVEAFLGRVNRLFPVHTEIWDLDLDAAQWRLSEIPVMPLGYDTWNEGWDDLKEPAPYLLHMRYSRGNEDYAFVRDEFADLYPDHQVPSTLEPHRLVEALRQMTMPAPELAALPELILMLDHSTGNAWLDTGEYTLAEGGIYPTWSRENVAWLAEEWQSAQPVLEKVMALLNWKNDSAGAVAEKLAAVRAVLLEADKRTQEDERRDATTPTTKA
jgi:hypothetical protein